MEIRDGRRAAGNDDSRQYYCARVDDNNFNNIISMVVNNNNYLSCRCLAAVKEDRIISRPKRFSPHTPPIAPLYAFHGGGGYSDGAFLPTVARSAAVSSAAGSSDDCRAAAV